MRIECGGMLLGLFLQGMLILVSVVLLAFDSMLFSPSVYATHYVIENFNDVPS